MWVGVVDCLTHSGEPKAFKRARLHRRTVHVYSFVEDNLLTAIALWLFSVTSFSELTLSAPLKECYRSEGGFTDRNSA